MPRLKQYSPGSWAGKEGVTISSEQRDRILTIAEGSRLVEISRECASLVKKLICEYPRLSEEEKLQIQQKIEELRKEQEKLGSSNLP
jgi:hypothetical protein